MADTKISELPVATAIASPDVAPIVQGGVTKQADVSLFGGSFLSENIARVDPIGDDSTGTVGDLDKPFLTVQAALDNGARVVLLPYNLNSSPVDVTVSVTTDVVFIGYGASNGYVNSQLGSITVTGSASLVGVFLSRVAALSISAPNAGTLLEVYLQDAFVNGDISSGSGTNIEALFNGGAVYGTISCADGDGNGVNVRGLMGGATLLNFPTIDAPNAPLGIVNSYIDTITRASSILSTDSFINTNNSGVIPTYADSFRNVSRMDFSTLPTSEPSTAGSAWIDTTGGLNIVKVKL